MNKEKIPENPDSENLPNLARSQAPRLQEI